MVTQLNATVCSQGCLPVTRCSHLLSYRYFLCLPSWPLNFTSDSAACADKIFCGLRHISGWQGSASNLHLSLLLSFLGLFMEHWCLKALVDLQVGDLPPLGQLSTNECWETNVSPGWSLAEQFKRHPTPHLGFWLFDAWLLTVVISIMCPGLAFLVSLFLALGIISQTMICAQTLVSGFARE